MTKTPKPLADASLEQIIGGGRTPSFQALPDLDANGAFHGAQASDAYFVKCDSETTTQTAAKPTKTQTVRAVQIMK